VKAPLRLVPAARPCGKPETESLAQAFALARLMSRTDLPDIERRAFQQIARLIWQAARNELIHQAFDQKRS
jgi:hypothetical protein